MDHSVTHFNFNFISFHSFSLGISIKLTVLVGSLCTPSEGHLLSGTISKGGQHIDTSEFMQILRGTNEVA